MYFIVDDHGQYLGKYEERQEAVEALEALVEGGEPLAADECAVIQLDALGRRVGEPILYGSTVSA